MASRSATSANPAPSVSMSRMVVKPASRFRRAAATPWMMHVAIDFTMTGGVTSSSGCSRLCAWPSMRPGMSVRSPRSMVRAPPGASPPTDWIRPSRTTMSALVCTVPATGSSSRAARMTMTSPAGPGWAMNGSETRATSTAGANGILRVMWSPPRVGWRAAAGWVFPRARRSMHGERGGGKRAAWRSQRSGRARSSAATRRVTRRTAAVS